MNYQPVRDFVGYGKDPPTIQWPNNARLALNFVINYEEGAEYSIGEGDGRSETILSDVAPSAPIAGRRDRNMESLYEYGSRVGIWRLARLFSDRKLAEAGERECFLCIEDQSIGMDDRRPRRRREEASKKAPRTGGASVSE